uniref:Fatty acyl-CoA reductase n=1 Tax=Clastoptera arizonana TaxID=38151 RepID=A0A1B6CB27_9HEMI
MNSDRMTEPGSAIVEFFHGRNVMITGATGFMGKVLVEKLLHSCPDIGTLYLLVRPKRGHDVRTRLEELLNAKLFDSLRRTNPERLTKLVPVCGDITLPDLGLSKSDQKILEDNVSVVFHSAATVKFDEALKLSVEMNLIGTKRLVELCGRMTKLEALVHVSTAYCNCNRQEVNEVIYPPPADPEKIIQWTEWMDDKLIDSVTPEIIKNRPNTYTFTKALAEHILVEQSGRLPIAIVRPSIVTASWKGPLPGWVDNLNGPTGILAGAGKGILRTLLCYRDLIADLIPVDIAINLMITVAWHTATSRPNNIVVYNCTSGSSNPIYWRNIEEWGQEFLIKHPYSDVIWYPGGSFKTNHLINSICVNLFQILPAYILDFASRISGNKPIMMKIQRKLIKATACLEYFTTHEWRFNNDNMLKLLEEMQPADRKLFDFNINELDWRSYVECYILGTRKFVMKDDPVTFPTAKKHLRRMYFMQQFSRFFFLALVWRVALRSDKFRHLWCNFISFILQFVRSFSLMIPLV